MHAPPGRPRFRDRPPARAFGRAPALVLAVALGAVACHDARRDTFVPGVRLVELQERAPDSPALDTGGHATLLDDTRPVLSAAAPRRLRDVRCTSAGCEAPVPRRLAAEPWLVLEIPTDPKRLPEAGPTPDDTRWTLTRRPADGMLALPRGLGPHGRERVVVRGLRPAAERDVTTAAVELPRGARLRLATGVQQAAWRVDAPPLDMTVTALTDDGGASEIYRRRLDPVRVEADRAWADAEIPLDDLAGRSVRFRFAARPVDQFDPRPSLPLWADPTVWVPGRDARPSVVVVSLDTLRARSTSAYGHRLDTTPYLTELAGRGALFERAFTTYANTLGSHMTLFTGLYPASHGVLMLDRTLAAERPTLAELLRAAGWDTAAVTEDGLLEGKVGFRRGFATWFENQVFSNGGDAPATFRRALAWASTRARTPFFLFVHTYAVHLPYTPPARYRTLFEDGVPASERSPVERERLHYEQEIRALDDELRGFVTSLESVVPPERLLLIVLADHGEEFQEHGQMTHLQLYDEVMQIPLVVRWEGVVPAGNRPDVPVSLVDVAPTILELLGLPALAGADGLSLAGVARGEASTLDREVLFAQSVPHDLTGKEWHFAARTADAKCLVGEEEGVACFDLTSDPGEERPLAPEAEPRLAAVHRHVEGYRERALPGIAAGGARTMEEGMRAVDPATERKLRALGYAQ